MAVVLPAPFSPIRPWIIPASTRRFTPALAWTRPNCLVSPSSSTAGAATGVIGPEVLPNWPRSQQARELALRGDGGRWDCGAILYVVIENCGRCGLAPWRAVR